MDTDHRTYRIIVRLLGVKPSIWREILVPKHILLWELHATIQGAMGWHDKHINWFSKGIATYENLDENQHAPRETEFDSRYMTLGVLASVGGNLLYNYDAGDRWVHLVSIEEEIENELRSIYPLCIAGRYSCPPEDCGGSEGYLNLINILKDANHPEHNTTVDWIDGFNKKSFSLTQANLCIKLYANLYREQGSGFGEAYELLNFSR